MTQASTEMRRLYPLEPQYRERVWGGRRLQAADPPVGEAWVAFEESRVRDGAGAGRTLAELSETHGTRLLGEAVFARHGARFPVLVKLLDCADWLSVQVHPNDEQARRLVGPDAFGKTEAWHFLEVEPGAKILAGVKPGTTRDALAAAIRGGGILDVAEEMEVRAGETILLPSCTLHALGPGMLLYEVQQLSDTTYRVYDWGRPAGAGRKLHIEESVAVTDPQSRPVRRPPPALEGTSSATVLTCPFFELDVVQLRGDAHRGDTRALSFHLLTVAEGAARISCGGETVGLGLFETALVAGGAGAYELRADGTGARVLRASLPRGAGD